MSDTSRRKLLVAAGTGAAAAATVGITSGHASATEAKRSSGSAHESVVAHVKDHNSSELHLLVGEREVVVHDRDLVTRILNAAGGE